MQKTENFQTPIQHMELPFHRPTKVYPNFIARNENSMTIDKIKFKGLKIFFKIILITGRKYNRKYQSGRHKFES